MPASPSMEFFTFVIVVALVYFAFMAGKNKAPAVPQVSPYVEGVTTIDTGHMVVHFPSMAAVNYWMAPQTGEMIPSRLRRDLDGRWSGCWPDTPAGGGTWKTMKEDDEEELEAKLEKGYQNWLAHSAAYPSHTDANRFFVDVQKVMTAKHKRLCTVTFGK